MPHEPKFRFDIEQEKKRTTVHLHGSLDEDSSLEKLSTLEGPINFNFKNLSRVNSLGIRNWVNFIKELKNKIYFSECSPAIVRQLSRVPSFWTNATILSVYARYICDSCDEEALVLVPREQFHGSPHKVMEIIDCEKCGKTRMIISDQLDQYFAFAK